ncbi:MULTISPECIES: S41 family peptidase [unclassified Streptomyces]|uniref:S41 family peptidase n=1 Tax=unclassified Streptomyces TaxID=2593676 RepID=UPI002DDB9735|nr:MULTISPECIES: PDZ domain-containing protein [unclassified Streptomyces]WSF86835.1 PDZ domain-containing protein [Streptomyces sp. NBC_01744]WSC45023.1 PDZ domain-containing protein [Streptomyces sp. NBC_01762]WSC56005.1 PDZ domain-containing protein [Streptomyces sp. NBC_01761]WSD24683.1 PDZ domain-containing protein [Streptomyces sp. NBC_01751]WSJ53396.1 PDZ domain-containing protein [Streptomyces sp. NBC_01318]
MTQPAYLRYPHVQGELIAFTAEDDVWLAPLDGGRAWRVSADNRPVSQPRISPDGTNVAWTSTRDGAPEVHLAPVDGGPSKRLTYWGDARTSVRGWTPEGDVLVISTQGQVSLRRSWARAVPVDGGPARTLPYGPVGSLAYGPGGRVLLLSATMGREAATWKRYRGGTAGKLWLAQAPGEGQGPDGVAEFVRIHEGLDGNIECPMWVGDRLAFLSDHEGVGALYSSLPDGSDLRRHTEADGFYARHATTDGTRVSYSSAGELWLLDDLEGAGPRRLDIRLGGQRADLQPHPVHAGSHLDSASPDRTGRGSAVGTRGAVHWVTHREGPARALAVEPGVRARLPRTFQADGDQHVVWVTDAEGDDALECAPATGIAPGTAPRRLAAGRLGRVLDLAASPDGSRFAVASHDGRILIVERERGEVHEVDRSEHGDASGLVFSPDSAWLAWSHPGPEPLSQLKLAHLADLSVAEATPLRFRDYAPAFTIDGKHLAFLSERAFDPVYDAHVFDLAFVGACRPHLLTLAATTPSPFGPQRHGRPTEKEKSSGDGDQDNPTALPVTRIDLEGLADRIVPLPVEAARYSSLRAAKDGLLWLRHPVTGVLGTAGATPDSRGPETVLERYDLEKLHSDELASDVSRFAVSGDGKRLVLHTRGKLRVVPADSRVPAGSDDDHDGGSDTVDLSRIRRTVEPAAEWRQMYDEAGRIMRDNFWRPDMGGVDWDGVLERYRPVLARVATHDDLVDLLWEVQGELGTSHAYVTPPGGRHDDTSRQGLLGADISRTDDGHWRIDRILPSETSDPAARSPLAAPGVAVRAGDAILAVDGQETDPLTGPGPLLTGSAGKPVELTVEPADGGNLRHVVVVPTADEEALRYHAWVADRRAYVHERSGGRLGYLHVPDMVGSGWAQLHRDLRVEVAREGLVVDVRENRGGHTSQLVVEKLARRIVGWDLPRGMQPYSYPGDAPRGPVVAVANEFSGSDGDIVNAAIKALRIGPVVGTRTWGGVVGIDSRYRLVDGTLVTQPKYAFWLEGYGWGVENHGVDPDVEVVMAPQDHASGRDPQLDAAIRIALEGLAESPAKTAPGLPG